MQKMINRYLIILLTIFFAGCEDNETQMNEIEESTPGMEKYKYLCSDGGPFIVIQNSLSSKWRGHKINMANPLDPKTDYGRACSIKDKWGMITVGMGTALVLADPPMISLGRSEGDKCIDIYVLQMWSNQNLDSLIDQALSGTSVDEFIDTGKLLEVDDSGLLILYAGDKVGDTIYGELNIAVNYGIYSLYKAHYRDKNVELDIYRLRKRDAQQVNKMTKP
ncbi:MAG: hypothetical protein KAJ52_08155 [Sedimentisphaerales bacterium]|nr:hypothetical protein [Sedimentisphaerales bacterium]